MIAAGLQPLLKHIRHAGPRTFFFCVINRIRADWVPCVASIVLFLLGRA